MRRAEELRSEAVAVVERERAALRDHEELKSDFFTRLLAGDV
ncbi:hypothetical protein [Cellulomonas sp.]|nr:hypothetical protein [Cellulomonas sp.]